MLFLKKNNSKQNKIFINYIRNCANSYAITFIFEIDSSNGKKIAIEKNVERKFHIIYKTLKKRFSKHFFRISVT